MWPDVPLNQLGYVARGKSKHRPRNDPVLYGGQYPFIQTGDIKHAGLHVTEHTQTYSETGLAQSRLWPANTLCITIAANIADTALLGYEACFPDSVIGFVADKEKCDVRFVKYFFATIQERMKMVSQGATQDNLNQDKLLSFGIANPPLATQKRIGSILSAYDDLIENNQRRIKLLEEAARRLYREWFVALRFPGHERAKVVDGVPQGWKRVTLEDLATLNYGKALKDSVRKPGNIPVYGSSGIVGTHNSALVDGQAIIVGRKGNVGSIFLSSGPFFAIDTVYYISPEQTSFYLFLLLKTLNFISSDSAVPGLNRSYAYSLPVLNPASDVLRVFEKVVQPFFEQISVLSQANVAAKQARDALLPRLMSGALAV